MSKKIKFIYLLICLLISSPILRSQEADISIESYLSIFPTTSQIFISNQNSSTNIIDAWRYQEHYKNNLDQKNLSQIIIEYATGEEISIPITTLSKNGDRIVFAGEDLNQSLKSFFQVASKDQADLLKEKILTIKLKVNIPRSWDPSQELENQKFDWFKVNLSTGHLTKSRKLKNEKISISFPSLELDEIYSPFSPNGLIEQRLDSDLEQELSQEVVEEGFLFNTSRPLTEIERSRIKIRNNRLKKEAMRMSPERLIQIQDILLNNRTPLDIDLFFETMVNQYHILKAGQDESTRKIILENIKLAIQNQAYPSKESLERIFNAELSEENPVKAIRVLSQLYDLSPDQRVITTIEEEVSGYLNSTYENELEVPHPSVGGADGNLKPLVESMLSLSQYSNELKIWSIEHISSMLTQRPNMGDWFTEKLDYLDNVEQWQRDRKDRWIISFELPKLLSDKKDLLDGLDHFQLISIFEITHYPSEKICDVIKSKINLEEALKEALEILENEDYFVINHPNQKPYAVFEEDYKNQELRINLQERLITKIDELIHITYSDILLEQCSIKTKSVEEKSIVVDNTQHREKRLGKGQRQSKIEQEIQR